MLVRLTLIGPVRQDPTGQIQHRKRTRDPDHAATERVAIPTVYASVGTKRTLLRLLLDRIDEEAGIGELAAELATTTRADRVLDLEVQITRQLAERCGDIIAALQSAAGVEPEMAATFAAGMARHRAGAEATVDRLIQLGGLRPELSREDATAIIATITAPAVYATSHRRPRLDIRQQPDLDREDARNPAPFAANLDGRRNGGRTRPVETKFDRQAWSA